MKVLFSREAAKDLERLEEVNLAERAKGLIELIRKDPFVSPPSYEALVGDFRGLYSRRINYKHRLVYKLSDDGEKILILRMWNHRV